MISVSTKFDLPVMHACTFNSNKVANNVSKVVINIYGNHTPCGSLCKDICAHMFHRAFA